MEKQNLLSILQEVHAIEKAIVENGGELPATLEEQYSVETIKKERKVDALNYVIERAKLLATQAWNEAEEHIKRAKSYEKLAERIKENVKQAMILTGTTEMSGQDVRFTIQSGGRKLEIIEEQVPITYFDEKKSYVLNRDRVDADIKRVPIPGITQKDIKKLRVYPARKELK